MGRNERDRKGVEVIQLKTRVVRDVQVDGM